MNEARPEIRQLISELGTDFWSDAQVDTAWAHALREISVLSGVVVMSNAKLRVNRDTTIYALAATVQRVRAVYLFWSADSTNRPDHYLQLVDNPKQIPFLKGQTGPEYCFVSGQNLVVDPIPSAAESLAIFQYLHVTIPTTAGGVTNLPNELLRAPIWLAASFLMNQNFQYSTSTQYYERAMALVNAHKLNFTTQYLGGAMPQQTGAGR